MSEKRCLHCRHVLGPDEDQCPKCGARYSPNPTKASDNKMTSPFFTEGQINNETLLTEGEELLGRFVIRTRLGGGQFGSVYHALDRDRREDVALKVAIAGPGRAQAATEQLRQELRLRDRINDFTHIIRTYDIHTVDYEGLSLVLLPMEYAEAGSLRSWLNINKHKKEQRISKGLELFKQACFGVKGMHDAGLAHLDLKPENLLLCKDGDKVIVKVSDFGISRNVEHFSMNVPSVTQIGLGTPYYMSPEQISAARQKDIGPQADVYALGIILFEILDGDPPFDGSAGEVKQKHLKMTPPRLKGNNETITTLVYKCLAKKPTERLANVDALLKGLEKDIPSTVEADEDSRNLGVAIGDSRDTISLDTSYEDDVDMTDEGRRKAMEMQLKRARAGGGYAMYVIGATYECGLCGYAMDYVKAVEWFRKSVKAGYTRAMTSLGIMYESGRGVAKDYNRARRWYRKAARRGESYAMVRLSWMFHKGLGVTKDYRKAVKWLQKAARLRDTSAQKELMKLGETW